MCMSMFLSHPMEFHVEATSITHWLSLCISSPQGGGGGVTVGAGQTHPPRGRLQQRKNIPKTLIFLKKEKNIIYVFLEYIVTASYVRFEMMKV